MKRMLLLLFVMIVIVTNGGCSPEETSSDSQKNSQSLVSYDYSFSDNIFEINDIVIEIVDTYFFNDENYQGESLPIIAVRYKLTNHLDESTILSLNFYEHVVLTHEKDNSSKLNTLSDGIVLSETDEKAIELVDLFKDSEWAVADPGETVEAVELYELEDKNGPLYIHFVPSGRHYLDILGRIVVRD